MAKRRLPKIAFDFIEGGLEDERGLERNTSAFHKHQLLPRYRVDVSNRDQSATLFGRTYASPFGISPTGGASLFRDGADLMLAEAAVEANIPYIMSGASNASLEGAVKMTVMLDSGVRRGADILIALCLGARFRFMGRPTLCGAPAGGLAGVKKAIDILRGEIDLVMGQIGCPRLDQLGPDFLWNEDWAHNR